MGVQLLSASNDSIRNELATNKTNIDARGQNTTQSSRTDLRRIGRCDGGVATENKPSKKLPSQKDGQRASKELDEDTTRRGNDTGSERLLPSHPLHRVRDEKCSHDLADRRTHTQTSLPWRGNDILPVEQISKVLLKCRCSVQVAE